MVKTKDLLSLSDLSPGEMEELFELTRSLKARPRLKRKPLEGKSLGCIFYKPSTRTAVSFSVGMYQLGGQALMLTASELQLKRGESFADTARTLSRYLDGIVIRANSHRDVCELAHHATVPVINGLSDLEHPCQVLTDLFTILERKKAKRTKGLSSLKISFFGDGNNMANSWILGAAILGLELFVACPRGYEPNPEVIQKARSLAKRSDFLTVTHDPLEAAKGADVVYTDVWASMGQEQEREKRRQVFTPYQVNRMLLVAAKKSAVVMHCLPAHRGEEITEDVIDGPQSIVFDQAENRLHVQKALLVSILENPKRKN